MPSEMATPSIQAPFGQILGTDIATITVGSGPTARTFKVHTDLICSKVPFFKAMFKGNFKEAATQTATLPEDDPLAFELFLGWVYRDTVNKLSHMTPYLKLFGFAEKYTVVTLMDNTMDALVAAFKEKNYLFHQVYMEEIYQITHESSKMRVFASRCFAFALMTCPDTGIWSTTTLMSMTSTHRDEILVDSLRLIRALKPENKISLFPDPRSAPLCDYHQHGKDEVCPYIKV
ncbi:uncharacterized protein L3040_002041 [Drepanopeziza brunnea f. sp. 'multigermtubi']|uniref:BTB domain-containing protein n=1 Tax=Marssonina brunnea f. sp. multigermtubi (strain MB_m1) TaxID=1072389 RepID=K1WLM5_MARBU|nr:uncharacterized protein MBM_02857 [Drepanopeziza brunnea f. sp. 'multigermtubi' MB_m1]EKD18615.1 hypothetical protein MBM_02857 [Drepanopeziza brunnea f. sp. 'multigermtubi' MB_m1]KAJ5052287.1 hypothetical protein L3040_002041 [Drepanopeziza brunnea f. sp. 'multigermtubi']